MMRKRPHTYVRGELLRLILISKHQDRPRIVPDLPATVVSMVTRPMRRKYSAGLLCTKCNRHTTSMVMLRLRYLNYLNSLHRIIIFPSEGLRHHTIRPHNTSHLHPQLIHRSHTPRVKHPTTINHPRTRAKCQIPNLTTIPLIRNINNLRTRKVSRGKKTPSTLSTTAALPVPQHMHSQDST